MKFKISFISSFLILLFGCTKKESSNTNTSITGLTITTVAGGGTGDNGVLATAASLRLPYSIFVDASGNIYFTECSVSNRVRKINTNGIIITVAGDGIAGNLGFAGDGGLAINAQLYFPFGVIGDLSGNIYFTDANNHRIRKVDNNGIITTIAGGGGGSTANAPISAIGVSLNSPAGITMDATGNLYFADYSFDMIFKINTQGILSLVAGSGNPNYRGDGGLASATGMNPMGLKLDASGNIYFADKSNNRIRKIDKTGIITTVAGNGTQGFSGDGGSATSAQLNQPVDIAIGDSGIIYISDWWNNRIRKVDPNGVISTFAGNGTSGFGGDGGSPINAVLQNPQGLFIDSKGALYIGDAGNGRIRKIK
jgi:streptogramin lyase